MSVTDNNVNENATQMAAAFANTQRPQQPQQPQETTRPSTPFSFRNLGNLSRSPMGRTPASEVLSKLHKALTDIYATASDSKAFEITLIPIDLNQTTELSVSVLVVALRSVANKNLGVAYHTLIVEGSIEQPAPRFEIINGINTEIIKTVGDANDPVLRAVVANYIQRNFSQSNMHYADACVVPREFNVNDPQMVHSLAANALFATNSELEVAQKDFADLNLMNAQQDSNLTVRTTFGNPQILNAVGQPVRSDIQIEFAAAPITNQQQRQQQSVERVSNIARISGFMDLMWFPAEVMQNAYYQQPQNNFQRYAARFVVTALESTQLLTVSAQLLALVPALSLREGNKWVQAFRRQSFSNAVDMHDIGAVGIEVNFENNANGVGSRIDTKAESFKPEHYHKLVSAVVRQGLMLSLDIPECGPDTWYNGIFGAVAQGQQNAISAVIKAANTLTNNAFSRHFPVGAKICDDELNRIHLGSYSDGSGVRKDIRDIDYLAVMNLVGEKDPQVIKDWSDSYLKTNYPLDLRLAGRKRIISGVFSDVVFTGFATRVTFSPEFTNALTKGCQECGLMLKNIDSYADTGSFERATPSFGAASLMSADPSGLYRSGYGGGQVGNQQQGRFVNRW